MDNKKILYWTSQVLGWLFYYAIIGLNLFANQGLSSKAMGLLFSMYLGSILLTHLLRYFYIRNEYVGLKIQQLIPRAIVASILTGVLLKLYQIGLDRLVIHFSTNEFNWKDNSIDFVGSSILIFLWSVFYFAYQYFDKSRREEIKNLQWEALQNQIELNNLKSQLNPHFMFNSLNSIRALIDIDQKNAKESITKLSTLLRTSLMMGKKNVVSIEEEIDLVKNYLDLEKIRFEERLKVEIDVCRDALGVEIPPLMIQTLAENAIKHGIAKKVEGGTIHISAKVEKEDCTIEVKNPGKIDLTDENNTSIGIKNTKDRLRLMFGRNASFQLTQQGDHVVATILIKNI
ncbi:MAG: histidine kinase [Crocinitomicaceae bacterium]|nr:histidine kinase [Crocinitomicaceae bacterium]